MAEKIAMGNMVSGLLNRRVLVTPGGIGGLWLHVDAPAETTVEKNSRQELRFPSPRHGLLFKIGVFLLAGSLWAVLSDSGGAQEADGKREIAHADASLEVQSLLGKPLHRITFEQAELDKLVGDLQSAESALRQEPDDPAQIVWVGRRLAYLWRYRESIEVFSRGLQKFPDSSHLLRHRGHRWITLRQFDKAIVDLQRAAEIVEGKADEVEPDGQPNASGVPTSTLHTNIWYHLGLAWFLKGDFAAAKPCFERCLAASKNDDMKVATLDWLYMTLRRLGKRDDANQVISWVTPEIKLLENYAYHRRLLMYRGLVLPDDLMTTAGEAGDVSELDLATYGFGLAHWYLVEGDRQRANELFRRVVDGKVWSAFGYIAAETELARSRKQSGSTDSR